MAKKFVQKVVALVAVITILCAYSLSVSAATYTSTTTYYNNLEKIQVTTNVVGLTKGDEVTYLAYSDEGDFDPLTSTIVYVNQYTTDYDETTAKTFSYVTDSSNIGSSILMAKADSSYTTGAEITPAVNEDAIIDGATVTFNVSVNGGEAVATPVECSQGNQLVILPVSNLTNVEINAVTVNDVAVTDVIVTSSGIRFEYNVAALSYNVAITTNSISDVEAPTFVAGGIDYNYSATIEGETIQGTAYSVIADASLTPVDGYEIGVAFASSPFSRNGTLPEDAVHLASSGNARGTDNKYAIVVVDSAQEDGVVYYATYMKDSSNNYTYGSMGSITLTHPELDA